MPEAPGSPASSSRSQAAARYASTAAWWNRGSPGSSGGSSRSSIHDAASVTYPWLLGGTVQARIPKRSIPRGSTQSARFASRSGSVTMPPVAAATARAILPR